MNSKRVILLRSIDMLPDPRVEKYVDYYKKNNVGYTLVGWNRSNKDLKKDNTLYFNCPAGFGDGMGNVKNILRFNKFLFKVLTKKREEYDVIHACDFDTVLPALFAKLLWRKRVVFDIFDWYTDSRDISNSFVSGCVKFLEKVALRLSDYVIICDEERKAQLPLTLSDDKLKVMPNIPSFDASYAQCNAVESDSAYIVNASYVGILGGGRGLDNMLEFFAENKQYRLDIAGFGELSDLVVKYADRCDNIVYHGKVSYSDSLKIMHDSDLIFAMYYKINRNHIFAAPNKYYEGLFLGRPIVTTEGTSIGNKTEKYHTGFVIGEDVDSIKKLFSSIDKKMIEEYGINAKTLWNAKYIDYINDFMANEYTKMIS